MMGYKAGYLNDADDDDADDADADG